MRSVVGARQATALGVSPRQMSSIVSDKVLPRSLVLDHLGQAALADRDNVRGSVGLLLVESTSFDANGVDEEGEQSRRLGAFLGR